MRSQKEVVIGCVFRGWVVMALGWTFVRSPAVFLSTPLAEQEVTAAAQSDVPELVRGTPQEGELKI
jgi:hypothetical protein